ncbi:MAG TPA: hypothetical protein VF733_01510 [Candidatus Saccharimonadales bacterium]
MKTLETNSNLLTTPTQTYEHLGEGKRVTLVGVTHYAQREDYYPTIQDIIDTNEDKGAAVHYEAFTLSTDKEIRAARPNFLVRKRIKMLRQIREATLADEARMAGEFNVILQDEGIAKGETWEAKDIADLEAAQQLRVRDIWFPWVASKVAEKNAEAATSEKRLEMLQQRVSMLIKNGRDYVPSPIREFRRTMVDYRNGVALNAYDQLQAAEPGRDAVLLWGAAHIAGLGEGLIERGFVKKDEQLFVAIDVGALALRSADPLNN